MTLRTGTWLAAAVSALVLAGCGGEGSEAGPERPALPQALAQELARQADQLAETFAAGDVCGAAGQADDLKDAATAAVDRGQVPTAMEDELLSTVEVLVNEINCPPPEPPAEEEEDECEELEQQKKALDEQIKETKDEEEKKALEEEKKALEEEIKACKEEQEDDD